MYRDDAIAFPERYAVSNLQMSLTLKNIKRIRNDKLLESLNLLKYKF